VSADSTNRLTRMVRPGGLLRPALISLVSVVVLGLLSPSWPVATLILIYALAALAANLLLGYTGLLSLGQSVYFGVGGYIAGILSTKAGFQLSTTLIISAVLCALVAAFIGAFAIRRTGIYFVMITFAFAETAHFLAYVFKDWTGGENGLTGMPLASFGGLGQSFFIARPGPMFFYAVAVLFVLLFVLMQRLVDSPVGSVLVAIRENEARAEALGYPVKAYKLVAFMVSGAVTGIAGCLYAFFVGSSSISAIHSEMSITIIIITVLGGIRSLYGSLLGAAAYVVLNTYLSDLWPYWELLLGVALIAIVLFFKGGLQGGLVSLAGLARRGLRGAGRPPSQPRAVDPKEEVGADVRR
jgi:branched-chain amino acid transport system permease protein